jgi:hypothetical protein
MSDRSDGPSSGDLCRRKYSFQRHCCTVFDAKDRCRVYSHHLSLGRAVIATGPGGRLWPCRRRSAKRRAALTFVARAPTFSGMSASPDYYPPQENVPSDALSNTVAKHRCLPGPINDRIFRWRPTSADITRCWSWEITRGNSESLQEDVGPAATLQPVALARSQFLSMLAQRSH